MKKLKKLELRHTKIAKLNNTKTIYGGTDRGTTTQSDTTKVKTSSIPCLGGTN